MWSFFPISGMIRKCPAFQIRILPMKKIWHVILQGSGMIQDLFIMLLALVLGYVVFMSSTYLLAKWMLPKIEDDTDFAYRESNERHVRQTMKDGQYLAK
jgi:hypothetical protein